VSESFGGVRGVYNVHAYEDERRGAFEALAALGGGGGKPT